MTKSKGFKRFMSTGMIVLLCGSMMGTTSFAISDSDSLRIPGGQGTLTSNVWRGWRSSSGNTYKWDYLVSAKYSGSEKVERIRTTWRSSADLRNSASISMGVSADGASAGASSSWQSERTKSKYWENSNGAKTSSWRSNIVVSPSRNYRSGTISTTNTAKVKLKSDRKTYEISASV